MRKTISVLIVLAILIAVVFPAVATSTDINTCQDINEYNRKMMRLHLRGLIPDDFVYWEDLSCLGDFQGAVLYALEQYLYSVEDEGGGYSIYVSHFTGWLGDKTIYDTPIYPIAEEMTSMLYAPPLDEQFIIVRDDITYFYKANGKLQSIFWRKGDLEIKIYKPDFAEYDEKAENTGLNKLLSLDDEEFRSVRDALLFNYKALRITLVVVCILVSSAGVTAAILIYRKKKKKVALAEAPVEDPAQ